MNNFSRTHRSIGLRLCGLALGLTIYQACKPLPTTDTASAQLITNPAALEDNDGTAVKTEISLTAEVPTRSFRVKIWTDNPSYQTLEANIQERESGIAFFLKVLPTETANNPTPDIQTYQELISPDEFESFWHRLQALEIDQLPNATANAPSPDNPTILQHVSDAPTYQFSIKTQQPVLDHAFEVYGPRYIPDQRYRQIVLTFEALLTSTFGDYPFTEQQL